MSAHTPGPWVWTVPLKTLNSAHGQIFAHADYEGMWFAAYDEAKDEANARLIAAAPELLETLLVIEKFLDGLSCTDYPCSDEMKQVKAAIVKATKGESK